MTNPYRAMCSELIEAIDSETADWEDIEELKARARALLAQPVAKGPTDEELLEMWHSCDWFDEGATLREFISIARAVLARWGRPTPQPVAVSERLPGPEDCDEQGRCWWHRYTPTKEWHLQRVYIGQYNYWLPANALPTPEATND